VGSQPQISFRLFAAILVSTVFCAPAMLGQEIKDPAQYGKYGIWNTANEEYSNIKTRAKCDNNDELDGRTTSHWDFQVQSSYKETVDYVYLVEFRAPMSKVNEMTGPYLATLYPGQISEGSTELYGICSEHATSQTRLRIRINCAAPAGQDAPCFKKANSDPIERRDPADVQIGSARAKAVSSSVTTQSRDSDTVATPAKNGNNVRIQAATSKGKQAVLLVDTDDSCHLFVDDEDKGVITADASQKFKVSFGDHILKCKIEDIPDLVWRKVVSVKDSSQVAAVITLKALHLQYNQAVTNVQSQKQEANAVDTKKLREAEAEEQQREVAKAEVPQKFYDLVRGQWYEQEDLGGGMGVRTTLDFEDVQNGLLSASLKVEDTGSNHTFGNLWKGTFTPVLPNLLATRIMECVSKEQPVKPNSKQSQWASCPSHEAIGKTEITIVNEHRLELRVSTWGVVHTLTR
jgi:hypothetical protein